MTAKHNAAMEALAFLSSIANADRPELSGDDPGVPEPAAEATWHISAEGRSNSSDEFKRVKSSIEESIRNGAHDLINNGPNFTAGMILAKLTHKEGFRPRAGHRPETPTEATKAPCLLLRPNVQGWWIGKLHDQTELFYVRPDGKYAVRYDGSSIVIPGNTERVWWGPITLPKGWGP